MSKRSKISPDEMANLYESGYATDQIAKKAHVSGNAVRWHLKKLGVAMRARGNKSYVNNKQEVVDTGKKARISIKKMASLYQQGHSLREISNVAAIAVPTVRKKLLREGISMRGKGGVKNQTILQIAIGRQHRKALMHVVQHLGGKQV